MKSEDRPALRSPYWRLVLVAAGTVMLAVVLVFAQRSASPWAAVFTEGYVADFHSLSSEELAGILAETAKSNPGSLRRMADDLELRQKQLDGIKQLLTYSSEAVRTKLADQVWIKAELENIRQQIIATDYEDAKFPGKPFGSSVTDAEIDTFKKQPGFETAFAAFLDAKLHSLTSDAPQRSRAITDDERSEASKVFSQISIIAARAAAESATMPPDAGLKAATQVKLQQAQFLTRQFIDSYIAQDKTPITPAEMRSYRRDNNVPPKTPDADVTHMIREDRLDLAWPEMAESNNIEVPDDFEVPESVWANVNSNRSMNRANPNFRPTANRAANTRGNRRH